jgi:hypothetical protein
LSIALAAGVGTLVSYAVTLGLDALTKWYFNDDQTITPDTSSPSPALQSGQQYWHCVGIGSNDYIGSSPTVINSCWADYVAQLAPTDTGYQSTISNCKLINSGTMYQCEWHLKSGAIMGYQDSALSSSSQLSTNSCPAGNVFKVSTSACVPEILPDAQPVKETPSQAVNDIPAADLDKPLNPAIIAAMANRLWEQAASQPGYDGIPYPYSNPITADEVSNWTQANPDYAPTVSDFVTPNPDPATDSGTPGSQWTLPQNPSTTTNPAQASPQTNLGSDPNIGAPTLEAPPTAQQIAQPILDLLPNLRNFQPVTQTGICPRPTIELYGTHVLDAHCKLIEDNKPIIQAAMVFAWAVIALFIILSA